MSDLHWLGAAGLAALYQRRALSPVEVATHLMARRDRIQDELNAFCLRDDATTLAMARESERRWREGRPLSALDGVPVTIKDLLLSRGWPTLRGSRTIEPEQPWPEDAPAVARLREAGTVFLGKTSTSEFGWKGTGDSPLTGITRNPWDPALTPGASSAGAAVAAATGIGPLHTGSDGAGSIRIPSAFTGVFGLKPTYGRVPAYPTSSIGSLANVGPMTRAVADAAAMLTVIGRHDPRFWLGASDHGRDFSQGLDAPISGLRIGYMPSFESVAVAPAIIDVLEAALPVFEDHGARVERIETLLELPLATFRVLFYGKIALSQGDRLAGPRGELVDPGFRRMLERHRHYGPRDFLEAELARDAFGRAVTALFERFDIVVTPQMPVLPFAVGHDVPPGSGMDDWLEWSPFTYPFNLTTHPAASMPCGTSEMGLPVAMQVIGRRWEDDVVLRACHAFEGARPIPRPPRYA